jgi:hypothetical protein
MANVSANTPIFSRGSTVLDYWLVHAEGMVVQPLGARVEEVVVGPPIGRAEALIVRSRMTRRLRAIPAESIAAVEPSAGHLLLDTPEGGAVRRIPRPSPDRIAAVRASAERGMRVARAHAVGAARGAQAGTRSGLSSLRLRALQAGTTAARHSRFAASRTAMGIAWLAPRVAASARTACAMTARHSRFAASRTAMGVAWLTPRVAAIARSVSATGARLTLAAAVIVARGAARTARDVERAAAATAERGRASLEARRARQQRTLDD